MIQSATASCAEPSARPSMFAALPPIRMPDRRRTACPTRRARAVARPEIDSTSIIRSTSPRDCHGARLYRPLAMILDTALALLYQAQQMETATIGQYRVTGLIGCRESANIVRGASRDLQGMREIWHGRRIHCQVRRACCQSRGDSVVRDSESDMECCRMTSGPIAPLIHPASSACARRDLQRNLLSARSWSGPDRACGLLR